jgi:D-aminopeptidase
MIRDERCRFQLHPRVRREYSRSQIPHESNQKKKAEVSGRYGLFRSVELRYRVRELGIRIGNLDTGKQNSITDVAGVSVGSVTLIRGEGKLTPGQGPVRTGVTVILPHDRNVYEEKLRAGVHVQNGAGELTGALQVMEWGVLETPIALTNTLNVGLVHDALIEYVLQENPEIGDQAEVVLPVVGECDDSYLNDIRGRHVRQQHVMEALRTANRAVAEGSVGAGTGMSALGFKAGIGTASRRIEGDLGGYVLGVLVLANFSGNLRVDGVPVGERLRNVKQNHGGGRSVITVIATDAPLSSSQLRRIAARVPLALGRVGSISANSSGDISIAFSTTDRVGPLLVPISPVKETVSAGILDALFGAAVEAAEEAILNSIFASESMKGRDDHVSHGLPIDETLEVMKKSGRM